MKSQACAAFIYLALMSSGANAQVGYSDVLGKTFITGAGSTSGFFIMSVGVSTQTRSTVEVTFLENSISWFRGDVSAIDANFKPESLISLMINCRDKTYTPGIFAKGDAYSVRTYRSGSRYKWGDYKAGDVIGNSNDGPAFTKYLQTACNYAAKF